MAYRPLWQSKVSDARGRGLVLAVDAEFARLWNYTLNEWTEVSVDSDVSSWGSYFINASGGNVTLTLPASPTAGDVVRFVDAYGMASTNTITIARNGNLIAGAADDLVVDIDSAVFSLIYANATMGWMLMTIKGVVL